MSRMLETDESQVGTVHHRILQILFIRCNLRCHVVFPVFLRHVVSTLSVPTFCEMVFPSLAFPKQWVATRYRATKAKRGVTKIFVV